MLLLQIIFKFVFTALSCNMQNISRALCLLLCGQGGKREGKRTHSVMVHRMAGKGIKATGEEKAMQDDTLLWYYLVGTRGK